MDAVFFLDTEARALFIRSLAQTLGCTYICLWSYVPLLNDCLISIDGWYNDDNNQPSSSTGSLAYRLFNAYRLTHHNIHTGFVPGFAFKENIPYFELNDLHLLRRTSNVSQQQFYQGAQIKGAAFLSCRSGEIEIGMSTTLQVNLKMEIINWFQQSQLQELIPPQADQNWPSSSSSSLISLGSPDSSSLLFNVPSSTSYVPEFLKEAQFDEQAIQPTSTPVLPLQLQTMEAYNRLRIQKLNPESDDAAMTRAILAVISSPSSSSSSHQPQQTRACGSHVSYKTGAFKDYTPALSETIPFQANPGKQNMLKRSISMMRKIDLSWRRQELEQGIPPTSSQLHHKMSERKRREKLNESFLELRSLLPPGTKKDKASVLSNTLEYLSNLKTEVLELKQKNQLLEARTTSHTRAPAGEELDQTGSNSNENIDVQIIRTSESTSEEQEIDLRVTVKGGDCDMEDLIINILGFLKLVNEVSLVWMNADTELLQTTSINQVILRLKIKGGELDELAFKEAVTRIVADVTK